MINWSDGRDKESYGKFIFIKKETEEIIKKMSDQDLEKLANLIHQKIMEKQIEISQEMNER